MKESSLSLQNVEFKPNHIKKDPTSVRYKLLEKLHFTTENHFSSMPAAPPSLPVFSVDLVGFIPGQNCCNLVVFFLIFSLSMTWTIKNICSTTILLRSLCRWWHCLEKYQNYCETLIYALFNPLRFLNSSWDILQVYLSRNERFLHVTMAVSLQGRFSSRLLEE